MILVALSTLLLAVGAAQAAAPAQAPAATGVIAGRLTSADQGRPVRKAQVKLVALSPKQTHNTVTDADGRFVFPNLPAGQYSLSASKPGYLDSVFGALRPGLGMPGALLQLSMGQKLDDVAFRIPRGGVIAGIVTDEFGDPAFGVPVRAMRFGYANGIRVAEPVPSMVVTDDLGGYRIAGLLPGEYVVSAVPRDSVASAAASAESLRQRQAEVLAAARARGTEAATQAQFERARREQGRDPTRPPEGTGYVAVYHPSSIAPGTAGRVRVGASEQVSAVDIQLQVIGTGVVSGVVTGPQGTPLAARVQLLDPAMPIANLAVWFRNAASNGRFAFHGIPPGAYVVTAQASSGRPGEELTAGTTVQVTEAGEHDVALALRAGVSASGTIDLASLGAAVDLRKIQVDLMRVMTPAEWEAPLGTAIPDADGRFVIRGLSPGRYRVGVRGLPDGWMLASAMFDDVDAADSHLQVEARPISGGVVTLTSRQSQLTGVVSGTSGDPATDHAVLLFPPDRELWVPQSRRIHVAQPGADGRYTIRGLPPGEYRIAAVIPPEAGQQFDPEFLAQAMSGSTSVTIAAGEQKTQDLRVR